MKTKINLKAFIGPIGDDLPSLIPIIFALAIFFASFYFAFNSFNAKIKSFDDDLTVLQIGNTLRGSGFIADYSQFQEICNGLNVREPKFVAGLIEFKKRSTGGYEGINILELDKPGSNSEFFKVEEDGKEKKYFCSNTGELPDLSKALDPTTRIVFRIYPVVLDYDLSIKPVQLVVVAWR